MIHLFKIIKNIIQHIQELLQRHLFPEEQEINEEKVWENPFIDQSRDILMQILQQRGMTWKNLQAVVIDTDCPEQSYMEKDDVDRILAVMEPGLNSLAIMTDRPEYFHPYVRRLYEEEGLSVMICPKRTQADLIGNVILDLERSGPFVPYRFPRHMIYIPFYKKKWEFRQSENSGEDGGNLDIDVPIGYNIVTVKIEV